MATAAELKEQLKQKMQSQQPVDNVSHPVQRDRFIKGTFIDDNVIAIIQKVATIVIVVAVLGGIWLFAENKIGARNLQPWRVWTPSIYMIVMMFWTKPFLHLGWFGWGFVLVQSVNLSGYLFQAIQGITGVR